MSEEDLVDQVDRDPGLSGQEKETTITMYGDQKYFDIYSAKPTIIKSLLDHDHFELDKLRIMDGDPNGRIKSYEKARESDGDIVAIWGQLPVGTLTIKSKPRANNHQSSIISTEGIDPSVFDD